MMTNTLAQGTITKRDFILYRFFHIRFVLPIFAGALTFLPFWFLFIGNGYAYPLTVLRFSFPYSFIAFALLCGILYVTYANEYKKTPSLQQTIILELKDDGLTRTTTNGYLHMKWQDIRKIHDYRDRFIIYVSNNQAILIPYSFFSSRTEAIVFKDALRQYLYRHQQGVGM